MAGVKRFGREEAVGEALDPPEWLPAAGQGALAIVAREDDADTIDLLQPLNHADTRAATTAERAFLSRLEGGCQIPIGALATVSGESLQLQGLVASLDGRTIVRGQAAGTVLSAAETGRQLAESLIADGADAILREVRGAGAGSVPAPPAP
jgi:hydroxymethylbilane synthase